MPVQNIDSVIRKPCANAVIADAQRSEVSEHAGNNLNIPWRFNPPFRFIEDLDMHAATCCSYRTGQACQTGADNTDALNPTGHDARTC
jgi:hypothetical protein